MFLNTKKSKQKTTCYSYESKCNCYFHLRWRNEKSEAESMTFIRGCMHTQFLVLLCSWVQSSCFSEGMCTNCAAKNKSYANDNLPLSIPH